MKNKEITVHCVDDQTLFHSFMCNDDEPTEYDIVITNTYAAKAWITIWVGHASKKVTVKLNAHNVGTIIEVHVIVRATDHNVYDISIVQTHNAATTETFSHIKGIAYNAATISYAGLAILKSKSNDAIAHQKSNFLIMSEAASVKSIPSLQVHHNQVQCGHSTTISYLDPIVVWYMQQRGIETGAIEKIVEKEFLNF